jgi:hypothetical protein
MNHCPWPISTTLAFCPVKNKQFKLFFLKKQQKITFFRSGCLDLTLTTGACRLLAVKRLCQTQAVDASCCPRAIFSHSQEAKVLKTTDTLQIAKQCVGVTVFFPNHQHTLKTQTAAVCDLLSPQKALLCLIHITIYH